MVKKFLSFFYTDVQWKLLSLGLAFVLWIVAMNAHDPYENVSFNMGLQLNNVHYLERQGLVLLNGDELASTLISLGVRGNRSAFVGDTAAQFDVFVDMLAVDVDRVLTSDGPVVDILPVNPNLLPGFVLQYVRTDSVGVLLDRLESALFNVDVDFYGQVREGFEVQSGAAVNASVRIAGAREHIKQIARVSVEVDLTDVDSDIGIPAPLAVYSHDGEDITRLFRLGVAETTVMVRVLPVRAIPITVVTVGQMAPGYGMADIEPSVSFINVVGTEERLDEIEYIEIPFDLEGLAASIEGSVDIREILPAGLTLSESADYEIIISITVEPIRRRTFFVPRDNISQRGLGAFPEPIGPTTNIRVVVTGPQSIVDGMIVDDINIVMDLRNLPIGTHHVPLRVENLPMGVSLAEPLQSLFIQLHIPAQPDPVDPDDDPPEVPPEPTPQPTPSPPEPTPEPTPPPNGNGENGNGEGNEDPPGDEPDDPPNGDPSDETDNG